MDAPASIYTKSPRAAIRQNAEDRGPAADFSAKTKITPGRQMIPFPALRVGLVLVKAVRDKNVRRQRVVFPPHFLDGCIHVAYTLAECRERILEAIGAHPFT